MKSKFIMGLCSALFAGATLVQAQETNQLEKFNQQLKEMQDKFDKQQQEMRENLEKLVREQQAQINALTNQIGELMRQQQTITNAVAQPAEANSEQIKKLNDRVDQVVETQKKVRPSEFNPSIGVVGETIFSARTKGSDLTGSDRPGGFDINQRSIELNVAASVDPFAKAYAVINASADSATGEATLGVEEAALQTTSLPWNLELKAGRFFGEFGRLSYIHDHELPFVNRPIVLDQYIGGESKTDGIQINWLPPIPHYVSVTAGLGDQFGDDPNNPGTYRTFSKLNFFGRISTYFDLTQDWQLETGVSGLWNPRTEDRAGVLVQPNGSTLTEKERRVAGLDFRISYVPLADNQFRSITWGTEVLYSANRYLFDPDGSLNPANPGGTPGFPALSGDEFTSHVGSVGLYTYVTYKFSRSWSAGFLYDWTQSPQNHSDTTVAYSPYITWALSHWNQLRLQYTHTDHNTVSGLHPDDAIYLQWAWIIGSHAHGWQQR
jgi:hypothetical protein